MAQMRLGEHAMHTWDVAVMRDSKATVAGDAVELILDTVRRLSPPGSASRPASTCR